VLVSADDAFSYAFSSFSGSFPPVQLFSWSAGGFTDVTRDHLDLVREDALAHSAAYGDPAAAEKLGVLAGWVADECLTGAATSAWAFVDQQRQAGVLANPPDDPTGAKYVDRLRQFLTAHGYCPTS
jgi:hypothetical protein